MEVYTVIHYDFMNNKIVYSGIDKEQALEIFNKKKKNHNCGLHTWADGKEISREFDDHMIQFTYKDGRKRKKRIKK